MQDSVVLGRTQYFQVNLKIASFLVEISYTFRPMCNVKSLSEAGKIIMTAKSNPTRLKKSWPFLGFKFSSDELAFFRAVRISGN